MKGKLVFIVECLKFLTVKISFIHAECTKFCLFTIDIHILCKSNCRFWVCLEYDILF